MSLLPRVSPFRDDACMMAADRAGCGRNMVGVAVSGGFLVSGRQWRGCARFVYRIRGVRWSGRMPVCGCGAIRAGGANGYGDGGSCAFGGFLWWRVSGGAVRRARVDGRTPDDVPVVRTVRCFWRFLGVFSCVLCRFGILWYAFH